MFVMIDLSCTVMIDLSCGDDSLAQLKLIINTCMIPRVQLSLCSLDDTCIYSALLLLGVCTDLHTVLLCTYAVVNQLLYWCYWCLRQCHVFLVTQPSIKKFIIMS